MFLLCFNIIVKLKYSSQRIPSIPRSLRGHRREPRKQFFAIPVLGARAAHGLAMGRCTKSERFHIANAAPEAECGLTKKWGLAETNRCEQSGGVGNGLTRCRNRAPKSTQSVRANRCAREHGNGAGFYRWRQWKKRIHSRPPAVHFQRLQTHGPNFIGMTAIRLHQR